MPDSKRRILVRAVLPYVAFAALWIALSDRLLAALATDAAWLTRLQTWKELAFILVTALLLYWLLRRELEARQRSEGEQQQLRGRLIGVLESITDGFVALDKDWRYTYVNRRAGEMFGRRPGELVGKHIWTEFPEGVGQPFYHAYHRAMAEQTPIMLEDYYAPWDRWFENRIWPTPDGLYIFFQEITARKQAEQALHDSEERFRATFEQAAVGIAQVAPDGRWLHVNQKLCDIVGYRREELLQRTFQDITYPADLDADLAFVRRMLTGEIQTYGMEKRYIRKDGSLVWIYLTVGLVRQATGEPKYFISVVEDISERKRAQQALQESQRTLATLIGNLPGLVYRCRNDHDWTTEFVSDGVFPLTGYSPSDLKAGKVHLGQLVHPDDREPVWNAIQTALKEKRPYTLTYRLHTASGQEKWAWEQGQGIFSPAGELLYLEGFVTDVSDRKRAEAALQEREHFLQRVLDTEPGTVYIYDLAQRGNVFVNRHWLSSYGYTAEETRAMGESLFARIVHPDDLARIAAHHAAWRPAPEGETRGIEYRVRSKAGEWRWLHSRETAFARDPAGHVAQILGIAHDVTERKTAETALAERDALLNETGRIAKVGGWEFDPATGKGSWTDEVARIHDLDPSAETSAEIGLSFYHGEHRAAIERAVREAVESGKPYDLELELISAKGVRKWVRTIGHPRVEHGRVVRVSGSFQDITDRKQAEAALRENARQLETLSRRLLAAQESERRRVAHELHDEIGQLLTVVKLDLQTVLRQPGTAALAPALKEGMESIDRVVARVRDLSLDLRPSMLDDLGLVPALRWYVQRQTQRLGPEVKVTLTLPPALPRLPSETETACFRIAQEALTNVARHAGAQRIEVTLDARNRHIALSIHDDGRGFDTDAARRQTHGGGFGLLGMRERAELAGGRLTIDSSPGRGTTVRAHFPDVTAGAA